MTIYDVILFLLSYIGIVSICFVLYTIFIWLANEVLPECRLSIIEKRPMNSSNIKVIDWSHSCMVQLIYFVSPLFLLFSIFILFPMIIKVIWLRIGISLSGFFNTIQYEYFVIKIVNTLFCLNVYKDKK